MIYYMNTSCNQANGANKEVVQEDYLSEHFEGVITGAERIRMYLPLLKDKKVGLVVNQSSLVMGKHLLDTLLEMDVKVAAIYTPEHGFRGEADAGDHIASGKDERTGIPIVSLYGDKRKPSADDFAPVDILIFDIQDVGVRFYTYVGTLHYVMETAAETGKPVIVLDRPNPNGHYVDGNVLDTAYHSFVGMHPVPIVHGMTIGEYAQMINGEGWLSNGVHCELTVIPCLQYDHQTKYVLPVKPSPNLPNLRAVLLYPSLCLFEGTIMSIGRGTDKQFQVLGNPDFKGDFSFTPEPKPGAHKPKLEGELCHGVDFTTINEDNIRRWRKVDLSYLVEAYSQLKDHNFFIEKSFDRLAGTDVLRKQIESGMTYDAIHATWTDPLEQFKKIRKKYLLYTDFE